MSRSRKKTPITGVTLAESEKQDKAKSHRRYRKAVKLAISPDLETPLPTERQLTNPWDMAKEGKSRYDPRPAPKQMRK